MRNEVVIILNGIEKRLNEKRKECLKARETLKKLDDEYMEIEAEWFRASGEAERIA